MKSWLRVSVQMKGRKRKRKRKGIYDCSKAQTQKGDGIRERLSDGRKEKGRMANI